MPPKWTAIEAAYHLGEAYAESQGKAGRDINMVILEGVARELGAAPHLFEMAWTAWHEEMIDEDWTNQQMEHARYWLKVVVVGGLTSP